MLSRRAENNAQGHHGSFDGDPRGDGRRVVRALEQIIQGRRDRPPSLRARVLDDKDIYQYLPWDHRGWHAGGKANDTHIGFEICEPAGHTYRGPEMIGYDAAMREDYFRKVFRRAAELCAYLCRLYGLSERDIITHCEGYRLGIASNHADVMHWFPKHGESMDTFRALVKQLLTE